jgi:dipeptidase E
MLMKIVLYSGGQSRSNHKLHEAVVRLAKVGRKSRTLQMTYIPFCADGASVFYQRAIRRYRSHGIERFFCLPVDNNPTREEMEVAMKSDVIYLAGGNTFYFLKYLRETGMLDRLKEYAENGGVLAGLSAGGLIMSPTIKLAADEGLGPDENEVGLLEMDGMNLFPFEFSPHFEPTTKQVKAHIAYSLTTENPVFASVDGGGIIIDGDTYSVCGNSALFFRGVQVKSA